MSRTEKHVPSNQKVVDGRMEERAPAASVLDQNASASELFTVAASSTLGGATSKDVHESTGRPSGMSSAEIHHDGESGRKKERGGSYQWGAPGKKALDREERDREKLGEKGR